MLGPLALYIRLCHPEDGVHNFHVLPTTIRTALLPCLVGPALLTHALRPIKTTVDLLSNTASTGPALLPFYFPSLRRNFIQERMRR